MKKINKTQARKLWNAGKEFWMVACNMRYDCGLLIDPTRIATDFNNEFDKLYNAFVYYNCDNERGRYPAFYVNP